MTTLAIAKLLSIASEAIEATGPKNLLPDLALNLGSLHDDFCQMLGEKNGFYGFESALHVFPVCTSNAVNLTNWNKTTGWKRNYGIAVKKCIFFAQDIFANQFGIDPDGIWVFDPELGSRKKIAGNLDEWADAILHRYNELTGYYLGHEWQIKNSPLTPGFRLAPKLPFILGGKFECENLFAVESAECMSYYAEIYRQTKNLKDGETVRLTTTKANHRVPVRNHRVPVYRKSKS